MHEATMAAGCTCMTKKRIFFFFNKEKRALDMCSMCMRDSVDLVFLEFITKPLGIGFVIIKIDAYQLRLVF